MSSTEELCLVNDEILPSLHILSDDPLLIIFSMLSLEDRLRLEAVCKRWSYLLKSMWKDTKHLSVPFVVGLNGNIPLCLYNPAALFNRCAPFVHSIAFEKWRENELVDLKIWMKVLADLVDTKFSKLKAVDFSGVDLPWHSLPLLANLDQLESLNIERFVGFPFPPLEAEEIEDSLSHVIESLKSLKELKISAIQDGGRCLEYASMSLEKTELSFCGRNLSFRGREIDLKNHFFKSGTRENLSEFSLTYSNFRQNEVLLSGAPNLRVLDLSYTEILSVGHKFFETLAKFDKLEHLYLNGIWQSTNNRYWEPLFLDRMGRSASRHCLRRLHINHFDVSLVSEQQLRKFSCFGKNLQEFSLAHSDGLTSEKLERLLQPCENLEYLVLRDCRLDNCAMATIGRLCPNLVVSDFGADGQVDFSNDGVEALVEGVYSSDKRNSEKPLVIFIRGSHVSMGHAKIQGLLLKYGKKLRISQIQPTWQLVSSWLGLGNDSGLKRYW